MKQKLIHTVVTDMLSYLNNAQVEKLKEVLLHKMCIRDSPAGGQILDFAGDSQISV